MPPQPGGSLHDPPKGVKISRKMGSELVQGAFPAQAATSFVISDRRSLQSGGRRVL